MHCKYLNIEAFRQYYAKLIECIYGNSNTAKFDISSITNAHFLNAILVEDDNDPLCICIVYFNTEIRIENQKSIQIGYFEALDNEIATKLLFKAIKTLANSIGVSKIIGPMNGSTWDNYRFVTHSSDESMFLSEMQYPDYYLRLWENNHFKCLSEYMSTAQTTFVKYDEKRVSDYEQTAISNGYIFRLLQLEDYENELKRIYQFCIDSFKNNYLYSATSEADFIKKYWALKKWIDPKFVFLVTKDNTIQTLLFCIPDVLDQSQKRLIIKTIANKPSKATAGFMYILGNKLIDNVIEHGYTKLIHAFMHQANISTKTSQHFNGNVIRKYQLLILEL
jgi:hypothetical protein